MAKDIVERRKLGSKVVRLLDLPISFHNLAALEEVAGKVESIHQENGHTIIVVKN